jgi:hypothetical protein
MKRVQRKRTRGWRMPPNTVYVGRPTKWGNPWHLEGERNRAELLRFYRTYLKEKLSHDPHFLDELKGKDLACWCPLVDKEGKPLPCHADILIEFITQEQIIASHCSETTRATLIASLPIAPKGGDYFGALREVQNKIKGVPDQLCWRCRQNINSSCKAYLCSDSDEEYEYRKNTLPLCELASS